MSNTTLVSAQNVPTVLVPSGHMPLAAEPANITKDQPAVCELEVGGRSCGIQAMGRCTACGRAFCATHQAWSEQTYNIDRCAPCLAQSKVDEEKRQQEAEENYQTGLKEGRSFLQSGLARTALLNSGVQSVNIYQIKREFKKGFFNRNNQWDEVITYVRRGWILGSLYWNVADKGGRSGLAALLDIDTYKLIWVEPYLESYKNYGFYSIDAWQIGNESPMWIEAARAVRRLIELHHLGIQSIFTRSFPAKGGENSLERAQTVEGRSGFIQIEKGKAPGRIYEIHEKLSFGRHWKSESDIFLENFDADDFHATVMNQGNGIYALRVDTKRLETRVNGQILPPNEYSESQSNPQTYPLQDGDRIQFDQSDWFRMRSGQQIDETVFVFTMK